MTRWLEAARQAAMPADKTDLTDKTHAISPAEGAKHNLERVKSVLSEKSDGGRRGVMALAEGASPSDLETYHAYLRTDGPATYGAAAVALGWGATRAWQAEARLRATGRAAIDKSGKGNALE